jgi:tetratricopeptide (TPR) repeat protein
LPEAVAHAVGAGAWALDRYAVDAAVMHFAKAARWAEKAGDGAVTGELWLRFHAGWAEALRRSGRPQAAREHYERALPLATGTTKLHIVYQIAALETVAGAAPAVFSLRGEALAEELTEPWTRGPFRCSQAYWAALGGDPDRARLYAAEGLWCLRRVDAGDALPLWLRDRTHIIMARTHALWGEWAAARRYAALALAGNAARGDAYGVADAQVTLSQADHGLGRYAEAQVHAEQALVQADAAGDLRLAGKARYALAVARLAGEVTSDVGPQIARLLEIAEQTGDLEAYARGQLLRARVLRRSGAWEAALAVLQPLLAKARAVGVPLYAVMTLHQLAAVHLARGDRAAAQEMATEALALARRCRMRHEIAALTALLRDIRL